MQFAKRSTPWLNKDMNVQECDATMPVKALLPGTKTSPKKNPGAFGCL